MAPTAATLSPPPPPLQLHLSGFFSTKLPRGRPGQLRHKFKLTCSANSLTKGKRARPQPLANLIETLPESHHIPIKLDNRQALHSLTIFTFKNFCNSLKIKAHTKQQAQARLMTISCCKLVLSTAFRYK